MIGGSSGAQRCDTADFEKSGEAQRCDTVDIGKSGEEQVAKEHLCRDARRCGIMKAHLSV